MLQKAAQSAGKLVGLSVIGTGYSMRMCYGSEGWFGNFRAVRVGW